MAFAVRSDSASMADINVTPLVDVMLVLLIIFMVTAPLLDHRLPLDLPQTPVTAPPKPPQELRLQVLPGDQFLLGGQSLASTELQARLEQWRAEQPEGLLRIDVSGDADYQSAATAMAAADRAGITRLGLTEP